MDRRAFVTGLGAVLAAPLAVEAQQAEKVYRVGLLGHWAPEGASRLDGFRRTLRDLGYVEGRNLAIEYRWAEGRPERFLQLAAELAALHVDVIVASSTPTALAAKKATQTIPIVFLTAADPVGSGLVASLARPGGNVTGLSLLGPELVARQLQLLKEAVPTISRVAVLSNPANSYTAVMVKETEASARSLGVKAQVFGARGADALDDAFSAIANESPDALMILFDPLFVGQRIRIARFAMKHRLPIMSPHREYADEGGLMAYGASVGDMYSHAATYVDKILKGTKPADIPVEQPTKFELVVNLKTAKALGLDVPPTLLARADEVIE